MKKKKPVQPKVRVVKRKNLRKKKPKETVIVVSDTFDEKKALVDAVGGDIDLAVFFSRWIEHGRDASAAYRSIHPNVTKGSSQVLGCRMLSRVNPSAILDSYGLGIDAYIDQLKEGLHASKTISIGSGEDVDYIDVPDHKTRRHYHRALGELHKLEGQSQPIVVNQNNLQQNNNIESLPDDDLDLFLNR
jgi:hypothetical protein